MILNPGLRPKTLLKELGDDVQVQEQGTDDGERLPENDEAQDATGLPEAETQISGSGGLFISPSTSGMRDETPSEQGDHL